MDEAGDTQPMEATQEEPAAEEETQAMVVEDTQPETAAAEVAADEDETQAMAVEDTQPEAAAAEVPAEEEVEEEAAAAPEPAAEAAAEDEPAAVEEAAAEEAAAATEPAATTADASEAETTAPAEGTASEQKLKAVFDDSDSDDDDAAAAPAPAPAAATLTAAGLFGSDSDNDSDDGQKPLEMSGAGAAAADEKGGEPAPAKPSRSETLAAVFGGDSDSDSDEEDFSTFAKKAPSKKDKKEKKEKKRRVDDDDGGRPERELDDFDRMREEIKKKKKQGTKKRKGDDGEDIGSSAGSDMVKAVKDNMNEAGAQDEELLRKKLPATKKLNLLAYVVKNLRTKPLQLDFMDHNILTEIARWLAPDPERNNALPNIKIRDALLGIVDEIFSKDVDMELLKDSKLGVVMMSLLGHPKEHPKNKFTIKKVIQRWSKRVNGVKQSLTEVSQEERRELADSIMANSSSEASRKRRRSTEGSNVPDETAKLRAGESGFIQRARVPQPISRDYTNRPESKVPIMTGDDEDEGPMKKQPKKKSTFQRMQQDYKNKGSGSQKGRMHHASVHTSVTHI